MRLWIPESPRWLVTHGRAADAERIVEDIERRLEKRSSADSAPLKITRLRPRHHTPLAEVSRSILQRHRRSALVGMCLMIAQAYFYNAIFFTYAIMLRVFYGVASDQVGWFLLPFAMSNFLGPLLIGRFFDTWGRRQMLAVTYGLSGYLLAVTGFLFAADAVSAWSLTVCWVVVFFVGSAAASAAYLTVSETFPLEVRALAIALFYAIGTGIGGAVGPFLLGHLMDTGSRSSVLVGYLIGAVLMCTAAVIAAIWATAAERKPLEEVAPPLSLSF